MIHLLAEMPDLADYPSAKHAADAGLTPIERSSGSSVRENRAYPKSAIPGSAKSFTSRL
jgi:hypothetical protein